MQGTAVQFGAGNIGRGFLAQLFHESGLEVVFVDVAESVIDALNARREYDIQIVGQGAETIRIGNVRAVNGRDRERVTEEIARAEIVCTAVGANALPHIAPTLAAGLLARHQGSGKSVNVLLCENLHDAATVLREAVGNHLPEETRETILAKTGFVQAVVSRMVPMQTEAERAENVLATKVEAYKRLPVDANAVVGELPAIVGVVPVANFEAHVERKLYTHNCAHAILGYLGYAAGHAYGYEALRDPRIASLLRAALDETGRALIAKHGFDAQEHAAHVSDLLERFQNESLGDTCRRLARDPIRKLAPDDRLVGAARLCESQDIAPKALAWAIAAALRYDDRDDPSAPELQRLLRETGREATLKQVCRIQPNEPLAALIDEAMDNAGPFPSGEARGMTAEIRAIREDEREECLDVWDAAFPYTGREYFRRYFYGDVEWLPYYTQVAIVDGKLVSAVQICKRVVACGDFRLTMGGIANVATLPEYRGQGYNTACLNAAIQVMEADAMDFSLLFTGMVGYYARLSYTTLPGRYLEGRVREDFTPSSGSPAVRSAVGADLPAIRDIYATYNRKRPIAVQRYDAYWREWIGWTPEDFPDELLVTADEAGAVTGYVVHQETPELLRITELGVRVSGQVETQATAALLEAVAIRALQTKSRRLRFEIAFEPEVLSAAENILEALLWQDITHGMARLLHRDNLLRSFSLELNERWMQAGRPKGAVTFATPYGATRLNASGAFLSVQPAEEPVDALPQSALFGLMCGLLAPDAVSANEAQSVLLAALFPSRAAVYWRGDGF